MIRQTPGQRFKPEGVSDDDWMNHLEGYGRTNAFISRVSENMWCVRPSDEFIFIYVNLEELITVLSSLKLGERLPKPEKITATKNVALSDELADILRGI